MNQICPKSACTFGLKQTDRERERERERERDRERQTETERDRERVITTIELTYSDSD